MRGWLDKKLHGKIKVYRKQADKQIDESLRKKYFQLADWLEELEKRRKVDCHLLILAIGTSVIMGIALIIKFVF